MKFTDYKGNSKFLKLEPGENRIRILTEAEQFTSVYNDKESTRFIVYAIDRKDGEIKPFTFGASIMSQLSQLAVGQEYGFTDLPPYDIIINRKGSGMETEYVVTPARKDTPLTKVETDALAELKSIIELAAKLNMKISKGVQDTNTPPIESFDDSEIDVKDIPF